MRDRSHGPRSDGAAGDTGAAAPATPGRRTLTESLPSAGAAAPAPVRQKIEAATGADLSGVRVHDDEDAHESAAAVSARAYTVGQDIFMGAGQRADGTPAGDHLMAHELVHAAQQRGTEGTLRRMSLAATSPGDDTEREAERVAGAALAGRPAGPVTQRGPEIARVAEGEAPGAEAAQAPASGAVHGVHARAGRRRDPAGRADGHRERRRRAEREASTAASRRTPPIATVTSGTTLVVKGLIRPSVGAKPPVYVVLYHGRMVMKQSEQTEVHRPLAELAVTTNGPAKARPSARRSRRTTG